MTENAAEPAPEVTPTAAEWVAAGVLVGYGALPLGIGLWNVFVGHLTGGRPVRAVLAACGAVMFGAAYAIFNSRVLGRRVGAMSLFLAGGAWTLAGLLFLRDPHWRFDAIPLVALAWVGLSWLRNAGTRRSPKQTDHA